MNWKNYIFLVLLISNLAAFSQPSYTGEIAIKYKDGTTSLFSSGSKKNTPLPVKKLRYQTKSSKSVLDNIYILSVKDQDRIQEICDSLNRLQNVLYAEPIYQEYLLEIPNDPEAVIGGPQRYLEVIKAYEAWDITKSNENIIIGVIDTGTDLVHEDITENLYTNENDQVNGIDDDNNGYVDDYIGYDFADDDNDAQADGNQHGTHVSGISSAATNNGIGIASVGYHAKLSPLKIFTTTLTASDGSYEAIIYAADNGYDIINLSWGSTGSFSQFNQDIINYAVLEKDVIVIAAAGNSASEIDFFPASYENVLSVAATDFNDVKAGFSTFSNNVDISAPGVGIYSTQNNNTYNTDNGTSHAAPQVAGVAALVKDVFPEYTAIQVMERIRATADNIYDLPENQPYFGKLGRGRLNAFRAVSGERASSIRPFSSTVQTRNFEEIYYGDTVDIYFSVLNYLDVALEPSFTLNSLSSYAEVLKEEISLEFLLTGDSAQIGPFTVKITDDAPADEIIELQLITNYENGEFDIDPISFRTAPNFYVSKNTSIKIGLQGSGELVIQDLDTVGWFFQENEIATRLGIALKIDSVNLFDNLPDEWSSKTRINDFIGIKNIRPGFYPSFDYSENSFKVDDSLLSINQTTILPSSLESAFYISYELINTNPDTLKNISFGLFADWNLNDPGNNSTFWDKVNTSYAASGSQLSTGIRLLSEDSIVFSAINVNAEAQINDNIFDSKKSLFLSGNGIDTVGFISPTNVASMISSYVDAMAPNERKRLYFLFAVSQNQDSVISLLNKMEISIESFEENPVIAETFISCQGGSVDIAPQGDSLFVFFSDPLGLDTLAIDKTFTLPTVLSDTLIYATSFISNFDRIRGYRVDVVDDIAAFSIDPDTLFLGDSLINRVNFLDESKLPISWNWDFGNGIQASGIQNPYSIYDSVGTYSIELSILNSQGCVDTVRNTLTVLNRPLTPDLVDPTICLGETYNLRFNQDTLNVYLNEESLNPVYSDVLISFNGINNDTTFFISRLENGLESRRVEFEITIEKTDFNILFQPDINETDPNAIKLYLNNASVSIDSWEINSEIVNTADSLSYILTDTSISVSVTGNTLNNCSFEVSETLSFDQSEEPQIEYTGVCFGDFLEITPINGSLFGFYLDENLSQLVSKSRSIQYGSIIDSTTLYIVNLTTGLSSEPTVLIIEPENYNIQIESNPEILFLSEGFSSNFNLNEIMASTRWYVNGDLQTSNLEATLFFDSAGIYEVVSIAESDLGCIYNDSLEYVVEDIPPLSLSGENEINIYPNPSSSGNLHISNPESILEIRILDLNGKELQKPDFGRGILDLSLSPGVYIFEIKKKDKSKEKLKFILQD